jgi:hypothetical protein
LRGNTVYMTPNVTVKIPAGKSIFVRFYNSTPEGNEYFTINAATLAVGYNLSALAQPNLSWLSNTDETVANNIAIWGGASFLTGFYFNTTNWVRAGVNRDTFAVKQMCYIYHGSSVYYNTEYVSNGCKRSSSWYRRAYAYHTYLSAMGVK